MSRIVWDAAGERLFETGVSKGVLYVNGRPGVPWNGLLSVAEAPDGGEVTPYYVDGVKYLDFVSNEEFKAIIEAYTYPEEFGECDGTLPAGNGLFVTHQPKKSFGLSYRTNVGNDLDGLDHAHRTHIVYNATAAPTNRANKTVGDTIDPDNFSWEITTRPPIFSGYKLTAHFVIDSRETPSDLMNDVEDILYGTEGSEPRLPSAEELMFIFESYQASILDAGHLTEEYYSTFDSGHISETQTSTIDGGSP